jgi:hypothetical protein
MKGDFSRLRFEKKKHYTSVLTQQGRVQLDSDANEQRAIDERLRLTETFDIVGRNGAPVGAAGFAIAIRPDGASLTIGQGRFYVDGLLCESEAQLDFTGQEYLIDRDMQIGTMLDNLRRGGLQSIQVWLEAWQRFVVPLDDPNIKEVALGEADTTARLQTVWRVVVEDIPTRFDVVGLAQNLDTLNQALGNLRLATAANQTAIAPVQVNVAAVLDTVRAQPTTQTAAPLALADTLRSVHADVATQLSTVDLQSAAGVQVVQAASSLNALISKLPAEDCCETMRARRPALSLPGKLSAQAKGGSDQGPCLPSPNAVYRGLENQLYRVEIHRGGDASTATFKWSRDNAWVVTGIDSVSGSTLTVDSLGLDANFGFAKGQWVEISDDRNEFAVPPNQSGTLVEIQGTDPTRSQVTLSGAAPDIDTAGGHAKMRRWDQTSGGSAGIALSPGTWIDLENGIQVMFSSDGIYESGDYWLVPARTATGDIEWPPIDSDGQLAQPAAKIVTHRAPLACLHLDNGKLLVEDCRLVFRPLVDIVPPQVPPAMHVTAISWTHDDVMTWEHLLKNGLTITFDQTPSFPLTDGNVIVTLELPVWKNFGYTLTELVRPELALAEQTANVAASPASPAATTSVNLDLARAVETQPLAAAVPLAAAALTPPAAAAPAPVAAAAAQPAAAAAPHLAVSAAVLEARPIPAVSVAAPIATPAPAVQLDTAALRATAIPAAAAALKTDAINVTASPPIAASTIAQANVAAPAISAAVLKTDAINVAASPPAAASVISTAALRTDADGLAAPQAAAASAAVQPSLAASAIAASTVSVSQLGINIDAGREIAPDMINPMIALPQRTGYSRVIYIVDGGFDGTGNARRWFVRSPVNLYLTPLLQDALTVMSLGVYPRLRVRLMGHMIAAIDVSKSPLYLDGQCFANVATLADGTQHLGLALPSGNGAKASDFESWFSIVPAPRIQFTVAPVQVVLVDQGSQNVVGTVTLNYAAASDMNVTFSVADNFKPFIIFKPNTVVLAKGSTTQTVQITVIGSLGNPPQIPLLATLTLPDGTAASASTTLTVVVNPR